MADLTEGAEVAAPIQELHVRSGWFPISLRPIVLTLPPREVHRHG